MDTSNNTKQLKRLPLKTRDIWKLPIKNQSLSLYFNKLVMSDQILETSVDIFKIGTQL